MADALKTVERKIGDKILSYRKDPAGFAVDVLGVRKEYIWHGLRAVLESVRDNQLTAVPAGHSLSKTFGAGRILVPWFKTCFQPSTIITTAPSDNQVRNQLWREIHAGVNGSRIPLGGNLTTLQWEVKPSSGVLAKLSPEQRALWEMNFAIGFSTTADTVSETATKIQGWHNKWVLIVLDEAGGLLPQITKTVMESLVINERVKVLAIGNPTEAFGFFADIIEPNSGWNVVNLSVVNTPNYIEDKEVVPGLAGRAYERLIGDSYGRDSETYKVRVLGQKPTYTEGTFYGKLISEAKKAGRIRPLAVDYSKPVHTFHDPGDMYTAIGFAQFIKEGEGIHCKCVDFYYDYEGKGVPEYAAIIRGKGYKLGRHFFPPDIEGSNRKNYQTGKASIDVWKDEGFDIEVIDYATPNSAHDAARRLIPCTEFDIGKCSEWISMIAGYRKKRDNRLSTDDRPVYIDEPVHDSNSHGATMLETMALAVSYSDIYGQTQKMPDYVGQAVEHKHYMGICVPGARDDESDMAMAASDMEYTI
jgi:hypothetical protein